MKRILALAVAAGIALAGSIGVQAKNADTNPSVLKVALLPDEDAATVIRQNEKLKDYLEQNLNKKIELIVTTDYSSMIEAMRHGRIDVAYFGPLSYVLAKSKSDIEAFAAKTKHGSATYQAVVIANAGANVKDFADIQGRDVAYGDPASTSSHLIPKSILVAHGLVAGKNYHEHFLGAHDAVAVAVQRGTAQAGGLSKPIFDSLVSRGIIDPAKVKVLETSKPFPEYPWAMRSNLDPELKQSIKIAFYSLKDKSILKPLKADGLVPITDADYNVVRDLKTSLGL